MAKRNLAQSLTNANLEPMDRAEDKLYDDDFYAWTQEQADLLRRLPVVNNRLDAQLIAEEIGNLSQQLIALRKIADIHRGAGQHDDAFDHYRTALRLAMEIGDPYEEGKVLEGIAESTLSTQRPDAARIVFRQALDIFERLGVPEAESARIRIDTLDRPLGLRAS